MKPGCTSAEGEFQLHTPRPHLDTGDQTVEEGPDWAVGPSLSFFKIYSFEGQREHELGRRQGAGAEGEADSRKGSIPGP